jgi:hypothetical protein
MTAASQILDRVLVLEMVRVTEAAAIAAAKLIGRGDEKAADAAAVEAMRAALNELYMDGTVVIGEGERDEAPMLFIGEKVGSAIGTGPRIDIALDVFKWAVQAVMAHHVQQDRAQFIRLRIPREVGGPGVRAVAFDVFGADRWAHKNKVVLKITAVEYFGGHRVKKGFCQLRLKMVHQQADVMQLDLLPHLAGLLTCLEFGF